MNTIQKLITEKQGLSESAVWYLNDLAERPFVNMP